VEGVEGDLKKSMQNYKTGEVYGSSSTSPPLFERARWTRDTARAVIETHERLGCGCGPPSKSKLDARKRAMSEVEITVKRNGPYVISGRVVLKDADGNTYPAKSVVALCRCGASTTKPFCDGTHSKVGFQAAEQAVPASKE
jgi:CDGSH-type Zn-finger protein